MSTSRPSDDFEALAERGQAFLRRARELRGLSPHQLARIAGRLEAPRPRGRRRILVRAVAAAVLVLTASTALAWASGALDRLPGLGALFGRSNAPSSPAAVPRSWAAPSSSAALEQGATRESLSGTAEDTADESPSRASAQDAPSSGRVVHRAHKQAPAASPQRGAAPTEPPDSQLVLEGRSFARAMELWRARRNATTSLETLDAHERRFPNGQMRAEALVLRAEILLAGRREREALAALDQVSLDQVPRGRELRTLRGELRVRFDRCEDGRSDLAAVARGADAHATRARAALARCP